MSGMAVQKRIGEGSIVIGLSEWGIKILDVWGRWDILMSLPHIGILRIIFSPLVSPVLIIVGMTLVFQSRERELKETLEDANKPVQIIGIEKKPPKPRSAWIPILVAAPIAAIIAVLFVGLSLWF